MSWENATRLKLLTGDTMTRPTGGGRTSLTLPRSGILERIQLQITATLTGVLGTPNAAGFASIIRRVQLTLNNGLNLFDVSGIGYAYLLQNQIDGFNQVTPQNQGTTAVTITTCNLDMIIPVSLNNRDQLGLLLLQNDQTIATLSIDWEADATVASGGATIAATAKPEFYLFDVPLAKENLPILSVAHTITEDSQAVSAAGDFPYSWPLGNLYVGMYHFLTSGYTRGIVRAQQSNVYYDLIPEQMRLWMNSQAFSDVNLAGTAITGFNKRFWVDLMGSDGQGSYGTVRDVIDTSKLSDIQTVLTAAGAGTLYTLKRQIIFLSPAPTA